MHNSCKTKPAVLLTAPDSFCFITSGGSRSRIQLPATAVGIGRECCTCDDVCGGGRNGIVGRLAQVMEWHKKQTSLYTGIRVGNGFARGIETIQAIIRFCHTREPKVEVIGMRFPHSFQHYQLAALWEFDAVALTMDQMQALPLIKQKLGPASDRSARAVSTAMEAVLVNTATHDRPLNMLPAADVAAMTFITKNAHAHMTQKMNKVDAVLTRVLRRARALEIERGAAKKPEASLWDIRGKSWAAERKTRTGVAMAVGNVEEDAHPDEVNTVAFPESSARRSADVEYF